MSKETKSNTRSLTGREGLTNHVFYLQAQRELMTLMT